MLQHRAQYFGQFSISKTILTFLHPFFSDMNENTLPFIGNMQVTTHRQRQNMVVGCKAHRQCKGSGYPEHYTSEAYIVSGSEAVRQGRSSPPSLPSASAVYIEVLTPPHCLAPWHCSGLSLHQLCCPAHPPQPGSHHHLDQCHYVTGKELLRADIAQR